MGKKKANTSKKISFGHNRSKALNATPRTWKPNLQKVRVEDENGNKETLYLTAREMKTMKKQDKK